LRKRRFFVNRASASLPVSEVKEAGRLVVWSAQHDATQLAQMSYGLPVKLADGGIC
jgi:hypothetical protein